MAGGDDFSDVAPTNDGTQKPTLATGLIFRIFEFPYLDGAFVEIVEQACIDTHLTEVFLTHSCSVCAAQPILPAIDTTAAQRDAWSRS